MSDLRRIARLAAPTLAFAAAGLAAGPAPGAPAAPGGASAGAGFFSSFGPGAKKPLEVPDSFFDPFKVDVASGAADGRKGEAPTGQTIAAAVLQRGVSGIVWGPKADAGQAIIGDQVFRVGDELVFPDPSGGPPVPLVAGASVILAAVGRDSLQCTFGGDGDAPQRAIVPLKSFWRP